MPGRSVKNGAIIPENRPGRNPGAGPAPGRRPPSCTEVPPCTFLIWTAPCLSLIHIFLVMLATNNERSKEFFSSLRRKILGRGTEKGGAQNG